MRLTFAFAALGVAAFAFAALSFTGSAQAKKVTVETGNLYFCDQAHSGQVCETTGVSAGDTVTWNNVSGTHEVVQCTDSTFATCAGGFDLGSFSSGQTKSQTFSTAGDVFYQCAFHPAQMKGKIAVAAGTPTPTRVPTGAVSQTATATPATVPATGGPPDDGGSDAWQHVLLGAGGMLVIGAAAAFVYSRWRR
jgi:plastocyanin